MKHLLTTFILWTLTLTILGQIKTAKDYGFTHLQFDYKSDKVDILIKSKKGEENLRKPLFFFCQGSLPRPLIMIDETGPYGVFPFNPDSLSNKFHLVIVSKPFIPVICNAKNLDNNFNYKDSTGNFPKKYSDRNLLSYYVNRDIAVIKFLQKQKWVTDRQLVVAGHSEGSTIAAKMAVTFRKITHLIYSGGNPMGRIMSIIQQNRASETATDSTHFGEEQIKYWQNVVDTRTNMDASQSDTHKATFEFSYPPIEYLEKLQIPVLISYGTKDWCAPYIDYLRVNNIRKGKKNFHFNPYIGTEHNYFPLSADNKPNYDIYNWDKVANDWIKWLNEK